MTRLPFKGHFVEATKPLDYLHLDILVPIFPPSKSGNCYFLIIVNQYTSFKIVRFLKSKSNVYYQFVSQKALIENLHYRKRMKILTDERSEFVNLQFKSPATESGFIHSISPPYTLEHNGFAEHADCTILDTARCLLLTSNLPNCYWEEVVNAATHLTNSVPKPSRNNLSPYLLLKGDAPKIKMIMNFSCKVIFHIPRHQCHWKLAPTGEIRISLGFTNESAYHILKISDNKVYTKEDKFYDCLKEVVEQAPFREDQSGDESISSSPSHKELKPPPKKKIKVIGPRHPTLINAYISETIILPYCRRPKTHLTLSDPCTLNEALKSEELSTWMNAVSKELNNMKKLDVWEKVPSKDHYKLIGTTWVFKTKRYLSTKPDYVLKASFKHMELTSPKPLHPLVD
ncbi:hypothetical protein O181_014621 [Austropuccinia psidii MF-1]|uniref:Integrase catalytic domain-containing protein n=1 Tax=Austropuccinia psidii MF-1 TaxID=1389203 RepID=A0A9Q3C228_9BASI|nr:hypothetical protein [Austropuccinia psidii MF-1]